MEFLTPDQAAKLAAHITESVAKEIATKATTLDQQVAANNQHLIDMNLQYAQVSTALTQMGIDVGANAAQAKADVLVATKKLVMTLLLATATSSSWPAGPKTTTRYAT